MPFRFRRSLKILPGVKVNLSKGGLSTSIGGKGFHVNVGKRGVRPTVSLPGTGMSYTGDNLLASSRLSFNQNYPGQSKAQSDRQGPPPNYGANQGLPPRRRGGGNVTRILLLGGGILSSLCLLLLCSAVVLSRMNFAAPQPTLDYGAINTSVFGTALASKLGTLSVSTPMAQATATPIAATTAPTETAIPLPAIADLSGINGAGCIPTNPPQHGKVVQVVDGDTIKVMLNEDGKTYSVRYIGMDTPEMSGGIQYYAAEASAKNTELVYGKDALLFKDVSETDRYGRLLRYVIVNKVFVNYELVAQAFAKTASYPPDTACIPTFQGLEQTVSASRLGIWAAPLTIPTLASLPTAPSTGGAAACSCSGNLYNCGDFSSHASAQACYDYCKSIGRGDIHRLDSDSDGNACESLP